MGMTSKTAAVFCWFLCNCGGSVEVSEHSVGAAGATQESAGSPGSQPQCALSGPETFASAEAPWALEADEERV